LRRGRDGCSLSRLARRRLEGEAIDRVAQVAGREVAIELGRDARISSASIDPSVGGLIQTAVGGGGGVGMPAVKRSG
jgi:hypothetical protein